MAINTQATQKPTPTIPERAPSNNRTSDRKITPLSAALIGINLLFASIISTLFNPFESYCNPPKLLNRDIINLNDTTINLDCFPQRILHESVCPPHFVHELPQSEISLSIGHENQQTDCCETTCLPKDTRPPLHLQLTSFQSGGVKFIKKLKKIGYERLKITSNSGTTGSSLLSDDHGPVGVFKSGFNLGDMVARRIAESSNGLINAPEVARVFLSENTLLSQRTCHPGEIIEYIPHLQPKKGEDSFTNISKDAFQGIAFLHLLMDNRDPHGGNVIVTPERTLTSIDHDNSLWVGECNISSLIRNADQEQMPNQVRHRFILNRPFWLKTKLVERVMGPLSPELSSWILSLNLKKVIGSLDDNLLENLNARHEVLKAAVQQGVDLPTLYPYLTPHSRYLFDVLHDPGIQGETIADDYTTAIQLAAKSFQDPKNESDESLNSAFQFYFHQIAHLRVKTFAGRLSLQTFNNKIRYALDHCGPNRTQNIFSPTKQGTSEDECIANT